MGADNSYYPNLDYRVIFVSACSSFITLFIVNILNKWNSTKLKKEPPKKVKKSKRINQITPTIQRSSSTVSSICDNMIVPEFYQHTKIENFFKTNHYLKLLPKDKNWPFRKIKLLIKNAGNYSEALHQTMIDHFDPSLIEEKSNPYMADIQRAYNSFVEWRKWPVTDNSNDGWKYKATTKDSMVVYTHSLSNSALDIVRADKTLPYSMPVVLGVFMNESLMEVNSPTVEALQTLEKPSMCTDVQYLGVKCPPFIADRDFIDLCMTYIFKDGSMLFGFTYVSDESKFNSKIKDSNKSYIRGTINLTMYHMRPDYDGNVQHTKITFYSHILMNGFIPGMLLNASYMELVRDVQDLENNINKMRNTLYKPGNLWIFPNPFLKMMNIDISDVQVPDMDGSDSEIEEEKMAPVEGGNDTGAQGTDFSDDGTGTQGTDFSGIWVLKSSGKSVDEYYKSEGMGYMMRKMIPSVAMKQIIKQNGDQISVNFIVGPGGKFANVTTQTVIGSGQETEYRDKDGLCRSVKRWNEDKTQIVSDIYRVNDEKRRYKSVRALSVMTDKIMIRTTTNNHGKILVQNFEKVEETE